MSGPGLTVTVDDGDPLPPYEQVRRQLADLVGSGALAPGDRLPPVRQLAADLGLAVGTVARAYRELEAAGTVRSRRGAGTRVAEVPAPVRARQRAQLLEDDARSYLRRAAQLGFGPADALGALSRIAAGTA